MRTRRQSLLQAAGYWALSFTALGILTYGSREPGFWQALAVLALIVFLLALHAGCLLLGDALWSRQAMAHEPLDTGPDDEVVEAVQTVGRQFKARSTAHTCDDCGLPFSAHLTIENRQHCLNPPFRDYGAD